MTTEQFISEIAKYVQKYAPKYNIKVHSPAIAQAILESGRGTSELAVNAHNYHGLKYRAGRCPTACGIYYKVGSEQNPDGSYTSSAMQWMKFPDMENGVIGYFDFINTPNYSNLKGVTDPETYLKNIKADGYASSLNYVENLKDVIKSYNLTQYDNSSNVSGGNKMGYTNSSLVTCTNISPNKNSPRNHTIDRFTPHVFVGQVTAKRGLEVFLPTARQASCNYVIGYDGAIGLCVDEKDRSWCSSSAENDHRAITVEIASDTFNPYAITDAAYNALIDLAVDVCKRNGKTKLLWFGDKNKSLTYEPKTNEMVITCHRWFAAKACPGDYVYSRLGQIADEVNKRLGTTSSQTPSSSSSSSSTSTSDTYTVVKNDTLSSIGAKLGIDWKTIADLNGIKSPYIIYTGQVLKLPTSANTSSNNSPANSSTATQPSNSSTTPSSNLTYTVVKNDTLSVIGEKLKIDWKSIADLNGIKSPYVIYVGQVLKLPGESVLDNNFVIGDKVKVAGTIYGNGNGTGGSIKKNGSTMYVVDIVDSKTYKHYIGLSVTKGGARQGWAEHSILTKLN